MASCHLITRFFSELLLYLPPIITLQTKCLHHDHYTHVFTRGDVKFSCLMCKMPDLPISTARGMMRDFDGKPTTSAIFQKQNLQKSSKNTKWVQNKENFVNI